MKNQNTIELLKECDAGTKMAVASIDEVLDFVHDDNLKNLLTESKEHHETLGNELHSLLLEYNSSDKEPNPIAKGMSWMKTNMKLSMDSSDASIADLMTDGCNMGVKSLYKYRNQYEDADKKALDICDRLIKIEEKLCEGMHPYL